MNWQKRFEALGAVWEHDGNPERPYALLTYGMISNFFFNGSKIIEQPRELGSAAAELVRLAQKMEPDLAPDFVIGPATGAIAMAYEIASQLPPARAFYTEPEGEGKNKTMQLKRFMPLGESPIGLRVEDVITTGGSIQATTAAAKAANPNVEFLPYVLCLVNRSGHDTLADGSNIISLVNISPKTWERGFNPFIPGGAELVEPVRPKTHWHHLTREYH